MGILNVTPDSFSDGGLFYSHKRAISQGLKMAREGACIIDIGGESTRPNSVGVSESEQIRRVVPVIKALEKKVKIPISVDTSKAKVAEEAIKAGAVIVNDITGLRGDPRLAEVMARYKTGCVIMHIRGTPQTMQICPRYKNLAQEILLWLKEGIEIARQAGIAESKIIVDPGIGFGKTVRHNLQIIKNLSFLEELRRPIMIGTSRKSFIGKILDVPVQDRLMGTAASVVCAILNGAHIVRVHDVKEMAQVCRLTDAVVNSVTAQPS